MIPRLFFRFWLSSAPVVQSMPSCWVSPCCTERNRKAPQRSRGFFFFAPFSGANFFCSIPKPPQWDFFSPFPSLRGRSNYVIIAAQVSRRGYSSHTLCTLSIALKPEEKCNFFYFLCKQTGRFIKVLNMCSFYSVVWLTSICWAILATEEVKFFLQELLFVIDNSHSMPMSQFTACVILQNWRDHWLSLRSEWCVSRRWRLWFISTKIRSSTETWKLETFSSPWMEK